MAENIPVELLRWPLTGIQYNILGCLELEKFILNAMYLFPPIFRNFGCFLKRDHFCW